MTIPRKGTIRFYECEHYGDAEEYIRALGNCGAKILDVRVNEDAEEAMVRVEIDCALGDFLKRFKEEEPDAFEMSNLSDS